MNLAGPHRLPERTESPSAAGGQEITNKPAFNFGDRLEELAALIEWEPFIHLMAAGSWIRRTRGKTLYHYRHFMDTYKRLKSRE
jgi:hypothetical protein